MTIKGIPKNPLFKISYPIIVGLPLVINIITSAQWHVKISNTFFAVFYSGVLLFVSYLVYTIFAPKEVHQYESEHDFINKSKDSLITGFPDLKVNIVLTHLSNVQQGSREKILELDTKIRECPSSTVKAQLETQMDELLSPLLPGCVERHLRRRWKEIVQSEKIALYICISFFALAMCLALYVMTERIITVTKFKLTA
jgi:hypothetical protein